MNDEQEKVLEHYRELWVELGTVNTLREKLEARAREIHAKQRQLANKLAALSAPNPLARAHRTPDGEICATGHPHPDGVCSGRETAPGKEGNHS